MSSLRISAAIRLEYLKCLFGQPVSTLDVLPPGQTAAIITITASVLQAGISEKLSAFLQSISTVVAAFVIAITYSWSLTLVTSSGLVLIMMVYAATTPFLVKRLNDVQYADIQASTVANEILSSMRMIAACGAQEKMAKRYVKWVDESHHRGLRMSPIIALQQAPGKRFCGFLYWSSTHLCTAEWSFPNYLTSLQQCSSQYTRALHAVLVVTQKESMLTRPRTFALSFWYSLKMYYELRFNSAETLMVCVPPQSPLHCRLPYRMTNLCCVKRPDVYHAYDHLYRWNYLTLVRSRASSRRRHCVLYHH